MITLYDSNDANNNNNSLCNLINTHWKDKQEAVVLSSAHLHSGKMFLYAC